MRRTTSTGCAWIKRVQSRCQQFRALTKSSLQGTSVSSQRSFANSTKASRQEIGRYEWEPATRSAPIEPTGRGREKDLFRYTNAPKRSTEKASKITIIETAQAMRSWREDIRSRHRKVGLVPTMGALHEGHLRLIRAAAEENEEIVVSIFVNPTQFGPTEDLATYPKTWEQDLEKIDRLNEELQAAGKRGWVTAVFNPRVRTMYPGAEPGKPLPTNLSYVTVDPSLTGILEGAARPTFFRGVTTIVMKLFWCTQPDRAYFGQKDIQQLIVINRMVRDFQVNITIRRVAIERDESGLALSSRNAYLGERRKRVAAVLNKALRASEEALANGVRRREDVLKAALQVTADELAKQRSLQPHLRAEFEVEYMSLADYGTLAEIENVENHSQVVLSGTIIMLPLGDTVEGEVLGLGEDKKPVRLLDNILWRNPAAKSRAKQQEE